MARDRSPIVKQSRREGYALHRKAAKIMARKSGIPGQHSGSRQGKPSLYAVQLREKQKVRRLYGLLEKQFARLMKEASRREGWLVKTYYSFWNFVWIMLFIEQVSQLHDDKLANW